MQWRFANVADAPFLAELNLQLIADEGHRNPMNLEQLRARMAGWLAAEYRAVLFEEGGEVIAYALFRTDERERIHLRHFLVARPFRRRGLGRKAFRLFRSEAISRGSPLILEVLSSNAVARAFWRALGFQEYAISLELA